MNTFEISKTKIYLICFNNDFPTNLILIYRRQEVMAGKSVKQQKNFKFNAMFNYVT